MRGTGHGGGGGILIVKHGRSREGGVGVFNVIHGRSLTTIDPRIPMMSGRSTSGFHVPPTRCIHSLLFYTVVKSDGPVASLRARKKTTPIQHLTEANSSPPPGLQKKVLL